MTSLLTVKDLCVRLGVQPITVRQYFRDGKLRGWKLGKSWRMDEVTFWEDVGRLGCRVVDGEAGRREVCGSSCGDAEFRALVGGGGG